jgi:hypothetical protein
MHYVLLFAFDGAKDDFIFSLNIMWLDGDPCWIRTSDHLLRRLAVSGRIALLFQ